MWYNLFQLAHETNKRIEKDNHMEEFMETISHSVGIELDSTSNIDSSSNVNGNSHALASFVQQCGTTHVESNLESIHIVDESNETTTHPVNVIGNVPGGYINRLNDETDTDIKATYLTCESEGIEHVTKLSKKERRKRKMELVSEIVAPTIDSSDSDDHISRKKHKKISVVHDTRGK